MVEFRRSEPMKRFSILLVVLLTIQSTNGFRVPEFFNSSGSGFPPIPDWGSQNGGVWDGFKSLLDAHRGQASCSSLPQMKQFLEQFGYATPADVPTPGTEFDSRTEAAVKLYQQNFGLNTTGVLDESTLRQMIKPRCGREDVIDGVSVMNSSKKNSSSRVTHMHGHGVQHYSFFPNSPKWDSKTTLTYSIASDSSSRSGIPQSDLDTVFRDAFGEWANVVPIKFTPADSFSAADIKIDFAAGDHGDGKPFDGVLGVLAHAFSPEDGRLHFDAAESWVLNGASSGSSRTAVDLRSVAVHEIGHIIGLGHSADEAAVMFPNIGAREVKLRLTEDDVAGAQSLYGANPDYNPDLQSESRSQTETSSAPVVAALPAARGAVVALLVLVLGVLW